jgi:hypothetical protein
LSHDATGIWPRSRVDPMRLGARGYSWRVVVVQEKPKACEFLEHDELEEAISAPGPSFPRNEAGPDSDLAETHPTDACAHAPLSTGIELHIRVIVDPTDLPKIRPSESLFSIRPTYPSPRHGSGSGGRDPRSALHVEGVPSQWTPSRTSAGTGTGTGTGTGGPRGENSASLHSTSEAPALTTKTLGVPIYQLPNRNGLVVFLSSWGPTKTTNPSYIISGPRPVRACVSGCVV